MLRFYSNENFPLAMVKALEKYGYDVLTSYQAGQANKGIPDDKVLFYGTEQHRIVITLNRDDFIALHKQGLNHQGILICKDDRDYQGQVDFLHQYLSQDVKGLKNRLIRIQKQNQPQSSTPCFVAREYFR
jgi:hypothetical protein